MKKTILAVTAPDFHAVLAEMSSEDKNIVETFLYGKQNFQSIEVSLPSMTRNGSVDIDWMIMKFDDILMDWDRPDDSKVSDLLLIVFENCSWQEVQIDTSDQKRPIFWNTEGCCGPLLFSPVFEIIPIHPDLQFLFKEKLDSIARLMTNVLNNEEPLKQNSYVLGSECSSLLLLPIDCYISSVNKHPEIREFLLSKNNVKECIVSTDTTDFIAFKVEESLFSSEKTSDSKEHLTRQMLEMSNCFELVSLNTDPALDYDMTHPIVWQTKGTESPSQFVDVLFDVIPLSPQLYDFFNDDMKQSLAKLNSALSH